MRGLPGSVIRRCALAPVGLVCVVLALLFAQVLGQVHGVVHGHSAGPGHAQGHEPAQESASASALASLFADHDEDTADCRVYDQLSHIDAMPGVIALALSLVIQPFLLSVLPGLATARWHALFQARGPPSLSCIPSLMQSPLALSPAGRCVFV